MSYLLELIRLRLRSERSGILLLLVMLGALVGVSWATLAHASVLLRALIHAPGSGFGAGLKALGLGAALTLPLGGVFAHFLGPRRMLLGCGAVLVVTPAGIGIAFGLSALAVLDLCFGLAAGMLPAAISVAIGPWFPQRERGQVMGLIGAGFFSGGLLAYLITERLIWRFGATETFLGVMVGSAILILLGLVALIWLLAFLRWYRLTPGLGEGGLVRASAWDLPLGPVWLPGVLLRGAPLAGIAFVQSYGVGLASAWLDARLLTNWHFDLGLSGAHNLTVLLAPLLGLLVGGYATDMALMQSGNVRSARQVVIGIGLLGGGCCLIPLVWSHELASIVLWQGLAIGLLACALPALWTIPHDIAPVTPGLPTVFLGLGTALAWLASPAALTPLIGAATPFWLGVGLLMVAGILAFRIDPARTIELPTGSKTA